MAAGSSEGRAVTGADLNTEERHALWQAVLALVRELQGDAVLSDTPAQRLARGRLVLCAAAGNTT